MIKPSFLFTDNGMLQREAEVKIFGECDLARLTVSYGDYKSEAQIKNGRFTAILPKMPANLCHDLVFTSESEEVRFCNVITGDIWLAGGQSNMEHPTFCSFYNEEDISRDEKIRVFTVPRRPYKDADLLGWHFYTVSHKDTPWQIYDKESALTCSAVGTFFAKRIRRDVDVPIGILNCNLGASTAEAWISKEALLSDDITRYALDRYEKNFGNIDRAAYHSRYLEFTEKLRRYHEENGSALDVARRDGIMKALKGGFKIMIEQGPYYYQTPSNYRETMLNRVIPFAIKGVLWYQGESNSHDNPPFCSHQVWVEAVMRTMFADWRRAFENPTLPFYMVQLSAYGEGASGEAMSWEPVRSAHENLANDEGIHTIVSLDVGEADNIHPANKKPVGERLALAALSCEYGLDVAWESPKIDKIEKTANEYRLAFKNATELTFTGEEPQGFFIRTSSGVRTAAKVRLEGNEVYIPLSEDVKEISFCAQNFAKCNVYNEHGLPPFPFVRSV